jgi:cytochrome c biogenesis protein CcdA
MLRLLGLVLSIGFADSLNPSTIGPALYLASGRSPRRSVLEFTAGAFGVFLLGGLVLTLGPGRAILALVPRPGATTSFILETVAGAAMLAASAVLWVRRCRLGRRRGAPEREPRERRPLLMGAGIAIVELPTAFPYFAAIAAIVGSGLATPRQVVLVAIFNAAFVSPLLGIVLALTVMGDGAVELLTRLRQWMSRRWPVIAALVALVAGLFVITLGVTGLTGRSHGQVGRFSRRLRHLIPH